MWIRQRREGNANLNSGCDSDAVAMTVRELLRLKEERGKREQGRMKKKEKGEGREG